MLGLGGDEEEDPWAAARHERPPPRRHIPHDEQQIPSPSVSSLSGSPRRSFPVKHPRARLRSVFTRTWRMPWPGSLTEAS